MKILEVCTSRSWGGMEMRTLKISDYFLRAGHDVTFLCYPNSSLNMEAKQTGIKTIEFPFLKIPYLSLILKFRKIIKEHKFEIIHVQYSRDLQFIVPAIKRIKPKIPIVLTKRVGSYINKKDLYHKYLYSRVDLVTTISKVIKQNVIDTCPIDPDKVEIIYNGINIDKFQKNLKDRDTVRKEMNINDEIVVGIFGRLSPGKGHEEFLMAAKMISDKKLNVKFWIVGNASYGEDEYAKSIYALAEELKVGDSVSFLGYHKDIAKLMAAADIIAVPSHAEAFGNVAIEGMAAAKPVVASNTDGLLDIVVDGETGIQIPPKNSTALSKALIKLINDDDLRKRLGEAGLQRAAKMFDEEKQFKKFESRFIELIESVS
ncbi:MAG: glycosyltransferase family 4 protein [Ignavibacteriaceae bacterium]